MAILIDGTDSNGVDTVDIAITVAVIAIVLAVASRPHIDGAKTTPSREYPIAEGVASELSWTLKGSPIVIRPPRHAVHVNILRIEAQ